MCINQKWRISPLKGVKTLKKIISVLLVLVLSCFVFASCDDTPTAVTTAGGNGGEESIPLTGDFGGRTFRILSAGSVVENDFNYEQDNPDYTVLQKAQYERVLTAEKNFNIDIVGVEKPKYSSASSGQPGEGFTAVNTQVGTSTPNYDLCLIAGYDVSQLATIGYLFDMNSIPGVDLTKSYWDQNANASLGINGVVFFTTGEITVSDNNCAYCIMYNKKLADDYQIENPYELVESGNWTIEKLAELSKKVSEDIAEPIGVLDENDRYGLLVWDDSITGMINAAGQRCVTINDKGILELTLMNETTLDALNKYAEIAYDETHALQYQRYNNFGPGDRWWENNQGLFFTTIINEVPNFREMENDFGVLPYPKLTATQDKHYTTISPFNSQFICVPAIVSDIQCTGTITEALAYLGEQSVTTALYDITLVGKTLRDVQSSAMLDIIFENIVYDIGYYYQVGPYNKELIKALRVKNSNWQSLYDTYLPAAQSQLKTINDAYARAVAMWKQQ